MVEHQLELNPDKTEFILLGTEHNKEQLSKHFLENILGNSLKPVDEVRNLGVMFDSASHSTYQQSLSLVMATSEIMQK
jgi:hypothetical protein